MQFHTLPRNVPLAHQIVEILTSRIRDGYYEPETQMPSENELAEEFGVSRTTVRNAFSMLSARGLIVRRQGVGTFVSNLAQIANPLNVATDFGGLLRSSGIEYGVDLVDANFTLPDKELADALKIDRDAPILKTYKVFHTKERPLIYCITTLPGWLFGEKLTESPEVYARRTDNFYSFLEDECGQQVEYHIASIRAGNIAEHEFKIDIPDKTEHLLIITEIAYNVEERPLWHAEEYFLGDLMTFEVVRYRDMAGKEAKWRK